MVRPSDEEIDQVHKYIEYCLTFLKNKRQTIDILFTQANIEPIFTRIIWEELERQNPGYFKSYYARLELRDQLRRFGRELGSVEEEQENSNNEEANPSVMDRVRRFNSAVSVYQQQNPNNASASQHPSLFMQEDDGNDEHSNGSQEVLLPNGSNGFPHRANGSQQAPTNGSNGLPHRYSNGSQQVLTNGSNGFPHRTNSSQQPLTNASDQQAMTNGSNGLPHGFNGSQQPLI